MGRTSKFTFPVPGRKQKQPFGPIVSGPMSKAQKILGIAEINIDAPRQCDGASTSGISVCVSESTATHNASERSRALRHEDGAARSTQQWEQESEIVPACLASRVSHLNTADGGNREFTETSSLTRRASNSTITSWYDKSKMPLSISQQTSSSAMAKGLPQKANAVLDIEGKESNHMASPDSKAKKRPSRLDLGPLLSLHRHHSLRSKNEPRRAGDGPKRSPSLASLASSPQLTTPPPIPQRAERKLTRRSTLDSIKSMANRPMIGSSSSSRRGANDISTLPNLYEHYEQMTFDRVLSHDNHPMAVSDPFLDKTRHTPLRSPLGSPPIPDQRRSAPRPPPRHERTWSSTSYQAHHSALPEPPLKPAGQQPMQTERDYASSVSSRYTKTSRASKRTSHSINESDLTEKSVLSLSSDSEEDDAGSLGPSSLRSAHSRDTPSSLGHGSKRSSTTKHASFAPTGAYLAIPSKPPSGHPPVVFPRMSSLPATTYRPPPASSQLSRYSTNSSSSTTNSAGDRPMRPAYGAQETRASSVPPPAEFHTPPVRVQRMLPTKPPSVRSVDQPTPPMSPTSTKASIALEAPADAAPGKTDSRFMAVTRQEEMLLAALRMKRARMRESILAEYDDEVRSASPLHHQRNTSSQTTMTEMNWPEPPQTLRHQTSTNSNSTIRAGSGASDGRPGSTPPDMSHQRSRSRQPELAALNPRPASNPRSGSRTRTSSRAASVKRMMPVQEATAPAGSKHERVLLYLDRPVGHVSSMDFSEPSPDLSDYMDLDNGSEDDNDGPSGDASFFRSRDARHGPASKDRGRMLRRGERNRHESSPLRPRGDLAAAKERVRATGVDAGADRFCGVPRPDSPVSPDGALAFTNTGLSKKKAVRLSAVGNLGAEATWWGDDG